MANGVLTVTQALEESSDVAAVKLALRMGPDKFNQYIHDFGFGARTDMELPGRDARLAPAHRRWSGSSIGSIAMGQEIGVTPLQLVSMVSTIANGGIYLPPHILMQDRRRNRRANCGAAAFHPQARTARSACLPARTA